MKRKRNDADDPDYYRRVGFLGRLGHNHNKRPRLLFKVPLHHRRQFAHLNRGYAIKRAVANYRIRRRKGNLKVTAGFRYSPKRKGQPFRKRRRYYKYIQRNV